MKLLQIKDLLNAEVLSGQQFLDREVTNAFAADLMSDVLAFVDEKYASDYRLNQSTHYQNSRNDGYSFNCFCTRKKT